MNELDLIRQFRTDVPASGPAARAHADRVWRRRQARPSRRHVPRRLALALGALAALAAGVTIFNGGDGGVGAPDARAAQVLRQAAVVAEEDGMRAPGTGEYAYLRSREDYQGSESRLSESWFGADGTWHRRLRGGSGAVEDRRWRDGQFIQFGDRGLTYAQLLELPTDAGRLYGQIAAEAARNDDHTVADGSFTIVSDVLRYAPLPAELRAAFFRAAAMIPGIGYSAGVRDIARRRGTGISFDAAGRREILVFDPRTYRLLGGHEVLLRDDGSEGPVVGGVAHLGDGVVSSDSARPDS
jgi:hypothetical protein